MGQLSTQETGAGLQALLQFLVIAIAHHAQVHLAPAHIIGGLTAHDRQHHAADARILDLSQQAGQFAHDLFADSVNSIHIIRHKFLLISEKF